jgi:hypothetical protein
MLLAFQNLAERCLHFSCIHIKNRRLTNHRWMQPKIHNNFRKHSEIRSIPCFVESVVPFFALTTEFDGGEVTMHASEGFGAKFCLNFFDYSAEILNFFESPKMPCVKVSPVDNQLGAFNFLVDG